MPYPFAPSAHTLLLSLLAVRLGALTHCLVHLDMARDAQALDVVWVEAQPLHLLDAHG